jgi:hypothetical protein
MAAIPRLRAALPHQPNWAYLATGFTGIFLLLHLYWAAGGTWGLPLAALHNKSAVQAANWAVCAIMALGMLWILALTRPVSRRLTPWLLLMPLWIAAVICLSHALFGFTTKALYLEGIHGAVHFPIVAGVDPITAATHNHLSSVQDLIVFEPAFMLEGALITLAARQYINTPRGRQHWAVAIFIGVVTICLFGTVLAVFNLHVAVS